MSGKKLSDTVAKRSALSKMRIHLAECAWAQIDQSSPLNGGIAPQRGARPSFIPGASDEHTLHDGIDL
jgi:hypothetical protein